MSKFNSGMKSSMTDECETPQNLFDSLDAIFHFTLDAAASPFNTKVLTNYYTKSDNALARDWNGVVWCNPPYGREVGRFVCKAIQERNMGHAQEIVMLVAARTDTRWFQHILDTATEVLFIAGRLKFGGLTNSAPFPSALVLYGTKDGLLPLEHLWGKVVQLR